MAWFFPGTHAGRFLPAISFPLKSPSGYFPRSRAAPRSRCAVEESRLARDEDSIDEVGVG
jgi:hypothetical protein